MSDPAAQLAQLYAAGFDIQTFDRFPRAVGIVRDECILLMEPATEGLKAVGAAGWLVGESIAVLTTAAGRQVFQHKDQLIEATPERLQAFAAFQADVQQVLAAPGAP